MIVLHCNLKGDLKMNKGTSIIFFESLVDLEYHSTSFHKVLKKIQRIQELLFAFLSLKQGHLAGRISKGR